MISPTARVGYGFAEFLARGVEADYRNGQKHDERGEKYAEGGGGGGGGGDGSGGVSSGGFMQTKCTWMFALIRTSRDLTTV